MRPASGTERSAPAARSGTRDRPLPRAFYQQPVPAVARGLLGRVLVCELGAGVVRARIVEVEAYGGARDPASHAYRGRTPRNASMFGNAGHAYIYFIYGMHHCLNVVTGPEGVPGAVLIRALEPLEGVRLVRERRGPSPPERGLLRGPGCVTRGLGLDRSQDGFDLTRSSLWIAAGPGPRGRYRVESGPRVGIRVGRERKWRFALANHPCVSGPLVRRKVLMNLDAQAARAAAARIDPTR